MLSKLNPKAIVLGFLADVAGTLVFSLVIAILAAVLYGVDENDAARVEQMLQTNVPLMLMSLIAGLFFTGFGGYVAARVAGENEKLNAIALGAVCLVLGLLMGGSVPVWYNVLSSLLVIPAAYAGAMMVVSKKSSEIIQ